MRHFRNVSSGQLALQFHSPQLFNRRQSVFFPRKRPDIDVLFRQHSMIDRNYVLVCETQIKGV